MKCKLVTSDNRVASNWRPARPIQSFEDGSLGGKRDTRMSIGNKAEGFKRPCITAPRGHADSALSDRRRKCIER